jgi:hypothetical protein
MSHGLRHTANGIAINTTENEQNKTATQRYSRTDITIGDSARRWNVYINTANQCKYTNYTCSYTIIVCFVKQ